MHFLPKSKPSNPFGNQKLIQNNQNETNPRAHIDEKTIPAEHGNDISTKKPRAGTTFQHKKLTEQSLLEAEASRSREPAVSDQKSA